MTSVVYCMIESVYSVYDSSSIVSIDLYDSLSTVSLVDKSMIHLTVY